MRKRFILVALIVLMLMQAIPAGAAMEAFSGDFTNDGSPLTVNSLPTGFNYLYNCDTTLRVFSGEYGIGGKSSSDQSAKFSYNNNNAKNMALLKELPGNDLAAGMVLQFNFLKKDNYSDLDLLFKDEGGAFVTVPFPTKIKNNGTITPAPSGVSIPMYVLEIIIVSVSGGCCFLIRRNIYPKMPMMANQITVIKFCENKGA